MCRTFLGQHINFCSRVIHNPVRCRRSGLFLIIHLYKSKIWVANKKKYFEFVMVGFDCHSNCLFTGFAGADANDVLNGTHKNFAVTNLAGLGGFDNGFNGGIHQGIGQHHFDFDLG